MNRQQRRAQQAQQRRAVPALHLARTLRPEDPRVAVCEGHEGVMVLRPDETDPVCPLCGAKLCADCMARYAATLAGAT